MGKLLTAKEVAERFNVTEVTVFNWIKKKGLPVIKIGGLTRIEESALTEWIESQN